MSSVVDGLTVPSAKATARTVVECPHVAACAGCPLLHLDYEEQLGAKRARVVSAVAHYPSLELLYTRPVTAADPITSYRGRAKLIVSPRGDIGLYAKTGHHEVVDIPGCRVLSPALAEVAAALRAAVAAPPAGAAAILAPYDPAGAGVLRAVDLRETRVGAEVRVLCTLVLQRERAGARDALTSGARILRPLLPRVAGIAVNFHEGDAPQILGPETAVLDGVGRLEDRIGDASHFATFGSFVQAHRNQAARIHELLAAEIGGLTQRARVLDLYGGSGAISLALARAGCDVTMIESFPPAAANARAASDAQGLSMDVQAGDVAEAAATLATLGARSGGGARASFDAVVMNPPRRGVSPAARESIAKLGAPLCVYVSCEPDTLARDLDHFSRLGYAPSELVPFDMIPLTEEVETVAVLRRAQPPPPRVLYEDEEILVVDKGPHEVIHPTSSSTSSAGASYGSSLLQRAARVPGVSSRLFPVYDVDAGTSGLVVLARSEELCAAWTDALAMNGRLIYIAAAKSITPAKGAITRDLREGGRAYPARTRYRRLAISSGHSILRVIPDGGRTHQVRRHLAAIGHPVIGDERYGHLPTNRYFEEKHGLDRSFLHLVRVEIIHPRTGARLLVESTLPGDLRSTLERASGGTVLRFLEQKHALGDQRHSSMPPPILDADAPPSSRISIFVGADGSLDGPPSFPSVDDVPNDARHAPPSIAFAPDVEESPRTIRHPIVSDDED